MTGSGQSSPHVALDRTTALHILPDDRVLDSSAGLAADGPSAAFSGEWRPSEWRARSSQSEINLLGDAESVIDLDPEIANGALQLCMPSNSWTALRLPVFHIGVSRGAAALDDGPGIGDARSMIWSPPRSRPPPPSARQQRRRANVAEGRLSLPFRQFRRGVPGARCAESGRLLGTAGAGAASRPARPTVVSSPLEVGSELASTPTARTSYCGIRRIRVSCPLQTHK